MRGGRLTSIPASHSKRMVVLDRIAQQFEPGRRYPEPAVNEAIVAFHPDYATLRRYLVDEGFLQREAGFYWRSGWAASWWTSVPGELNQFTSCKQNKSC
jgi:hypothetical protein